MADFTLQTAFKTREPLLPVDKTLPIGVHTFQLVVIDDSGNESKPVQIKVEIARGLIPVTPVVRGGPVIGRVVTPTPVIP